MNQSQLKYARERIEAVYRQKVAALNEKFTTPARTLSIEEKVEALRSGAFTVKDAPRDTSYLSSFVDFGESVKTVDTEGLAQSLADLKARYQVLTDALVLGDSTEALAMIAAFEKE